MDPNTLAKKPRRNDDVFNNNALQNAEIIGDKNPEWNDVYSQLQRFMHAPFAQKNSRNRFTAIEPLVFTGTEEVRMLKDNDTKEDPNTGYNCYKDVKFTTESGAKVTMAHMRKGRWPTSKATCNLLIEGVNGSTLVIITDHTNSGLIPSITINEEEVQDRSKVAPVLYTALIKAENGYAEHLRTILAHEAENTKIKKVNTNEIIQQQRKAISDLL